MGTGWGFVSTLCTVNDEQYYTEHFVLPVRVNVRVSGTACPDLASIVAKTTPNISQPNPTNKQHITPAAHHTRQRRLLVETAHIEATAASARLHNPTL